MPQMTKFQPARRTRTGRALGALGMAVALALTATACGGDDGDSRPTVSTTKHNEADVAFATAMIPHHAQALSMVDLTMERTLDPQVQQLAEDIREAQGSEIEMMADWLQDWGEEIPETMRDHANAGHDTDDMGSDMEGMDTDAPGMMSSEDMESLENASDAEFQSLWLEMMIEHHAGAVEMATTEQDEGRYKPAIDLAGSIIEGQNAEIVKMETILGS